MTHRWRRWAIRAVATCGVAVAIAGPGVVWRAAPAGADTAAITVTPSSPSLYDGDMLTVTGTWVSQANKQIVLYECEAGVAARTTPGSMLDTTLCDSRNSVRVTVNPDGSFGPTLVTYLAYLDRPGFDCGSGAGCEIAADNPNPGDVGATSNPHDDDRNACNGFGGNQYTGNGRFGAFTKTVIDNADGQPRTTGSSVNVGDQLTITLKWDPQSFRGKPNKVSDCVQIGGVTDPSLTQTEKPVSSAHAAAGQITFTLTVPSRAAGQQLCDRGRVSGMGASSSPNDDGEEKSNIVEKSNVVCYSVAPNAVVPEASRPVLLLATAVGLGLLVALRSTRRRDRAERRAPVG